MPALPQIALVLLGANPTHPTIGAGEPSVPPILQDRPKGYRVQRTSAPVLGLGPRLAARIRNGGLQETYRFLARGLDPDRVRARGGVVTSRIGPIISGTLDGAGIRALAPEADVIEAPQTLRPLLDKSRVETRADEADRGSGFTTRYRGAGALVAAYDSGLDLDHPDLRELDGPTRAVALWDQDAVGTPPPGMSDGHLCNREALVGGSCNQIDRTGHGTHILSIAASGGPGFRGVAPEAGLVMARSSSYELFLDSLAWFQSVALAEEKPLVVNISLGGHEGPHDGTSLEAQAIDALDHLVVAAAGNDGLLPVHALVRFEKGDTAVVALRFPILPNIQSRRAIVEIWGDVGLPLVASAGVMTEGGATLTETPTVAVGDPGLSVLMLSNGSTLGEALLDPEASLNPINGQSHIRMELNMVGWEDAPTGPGYAVVKLRGEGRVDLWVDTPPTEPAPIRFDRERVLEDETQVLGDADHTISDLATSVSAVAVAAYTTRTEFINDAGEAKPVGGTIGELASFTSWGPTISPATTGPKPDLAAPGHVVIAAKSKDAPNDSSKVSDLYRASAGTSLAAPHVAGAAALVLGAKPETTKADLKQILLNTAVRDDQVEDSLDPRWGSGRLDAAAALAEVVEAEGCGCRTANTPSDITPIAALVVLYLWPRRRRPRRGL